MTSALLMTGCGETVNSCTGYKTIRYTKDTPEKVKSDIVAHNIFHYGVIGKSVVYPK